MMTATQAILPVINLKIRLIKTTGRLSRKTTGEAMNHMPAISPSLADRKKVSAAVVGTLAAGLNNYIHRFLKLSSASIIKAVRGHTGLTFLT